MVRPRAAEVEAAIGLFAASARNLPARMVIALATVLAALPVMPAWLPLAWFVTVAMLGVAELLISRWLRASAAARAWRGVLVLPSAMAVVTGVLYAACATAFWLTGLGAARVFAICQITSSLLYVLLQYYSRPKTFLVVAAPYLLGVAVGAGNVVAMVWRVHRPWQSLTVIMSLALLYYFFRVAREQLAASRTALRAARAEAQSRGVAAEAANAAKSSFLAIMSHEIRTPLNGVLGMAQAMAADELAPVQRERLDVVRQSGEALLAILNDVLDLSKIEAGRFELEAIAFDLSDLARGAHSAFTALANKKGLSFALTIEPEALGTYQGDPTRVRQILYNLISNALKFTDQGEVRVTVSRPDGALRISVADTGPGIAPDHLASLFDRFTQADASTTRKYGGTGLGLAICRELSALMGGTVTADSTPGQGAIFVVSLPLPRLAEAAEPQARPDTAPEPSQRLAVRVLAAEDNSVNQLVLKTLLHQIGVEPVVVETGVAALDAWRGGDWDVILMDMQMPEMDGLEATRRIRAAEAASGRPRTPIVALTANAMAHQIRDCLAAGMDGHVAKPLEAGKLFQALEAALEGETMPQAGATAA
ncbi:ATP-binding protein [Caulobacter sp. KR2-114]|uniref:ATP-binding protein n=1 Tax=Caulobacter sp. KR2-114 TaxID=3400912 RepID=UPI003C053288